MPLKCECGGTLRRAKLTSFDFSPFAGLPVELRGAPGLRCDKCKGETLDGAIVNGVLAILTQEVVMLARGLAPQEAKYLRKQLGLSQRELAERMQLARETVAAWECGQKPLSPQSDYILRGLVISDRRPLPSAVLWSDVLERALGQVHTPQKPRKLPQPFVIAAQLKQLRAITAHA